MDRVHICTLGKGARQCYVIDAYAAGNLKAPC
jgi:hypothetical protein